MQSLLRALSRPVRRISLTACGAVLIALLAVTFVSPGFAQISPNDILRQMRQGGDSDDSDDSSAGVKPEVQTYQPARPASSVGPDSKLETLYSTRAGEHLRLFGYEALGSPSAVSIAQSGAVPSDYILGPDDEIVVTMRGQENAHYRAHVDRDGRITIPRLLPVLASGRRFGDVRNDIEMQVGRTLLQTQVFVTIGNIRQVTVIVAGEVGAPGTRILSGLASPLDAILLSGGIKRTGSLRNVKVISGGGTRTIDLYSVVAYGRSAALGTLRDGDRIYVPPLGPTMAVSGSVARAAIYELAPGTAGASVAEALRLAGGPVIAGSYRLAKINLTRGGDLSLQPTSKNAMVRDGEVLVVSADHGALIGRITVNGEVLSQGPRPLSANETTDDLFQSIHDLTDQAYTPFAVIRRRDALTNAPILIPFSVSAAMRHESRIRLQNDDFVYVFGRQQIMALANVVTEDFNAAYQPLVLGAKPGAGKPALTPAEQAILPPTPNSVAQNTDLAAILGNQNASGSPSADNAINANTGVTNNTNSRYNDDQSGAEDLRYRNALHSATAEGAALAVAQDVDTRSGKSHELDTTTLTDADVVAAAASALSVRNDALKRTASDNLVWVMNEVREPGPYLGAFGSTVDDMIKSSGGLQQDADMSNVEITSTEINRETGATHTTRQSVSAVNGQLQMVSIRPMDVVRVRAVYTDRDQGTVTVAGEVRFPGVFDITRDERLSSLLQRAGGVSETAYPYGAIFTRKEAALTEKEGYERTARELESEIPIMLAKAASSSDPSQTSTGIYLSSLAKNLRETPVLGRVVITADPTVLAIKPELDFVLEPGDTLYIPKRPSSVTVSGEVLNSGSFQYRGGLTYRDYLRLAGGATQAADEGRTFIIMPDGSATPISDDWLSFHGNGNIPPGSTIVVPRDISPFNWSQFIKDTTQVVSQIAVTAASLAVISRNGT
ncbi:MAG TPA: SLBB domain-containing protein [Rhizomicrobium sp.]|nr:SLBB domain-containing protein [Rhizomicrobium sp.]